MASASASASVGARLVGSRQRLQSTGCGPPTTLHAPLLSIPLPTRRMRSPLRLGAATVGPPEPPFRPDDDSPSPGLQAGLRKIEDRVRIFFAVLFWMSFFFWGSACEGMDGIRKSKGRFRK